MATSVEQFTAPGKYYYELAMEIIEAELKNPNLLYNKFKTQSEKDRTFKNNFYYASFDIEKK